MELCELTANELHRMLTGKDVRAEEICLSVFRRIDKTEDQVKAYLALHPEEALEQARAVDRKIAKGEEISPLAGIPIALKDNLCTKGHRTTCASKILYNFVPPYNATVVDKLNGQDVVIIGKTNMDEFAMGSSTENSAYQQTCNPWNPDCVPGGSSGGSAAAVAAGEAICALGSDTGGSIRQPAAFCGVVGMKPTYGTVSRYGLVAFASSLDQIGPLSKDVTDCALMLNAICGHDPMDSTSVPTELPDYREALVTDIDGFRIGIPAEYFAAGLDDHVRRVIEEAITVLEQRGARVEETTLPHTEYALPTYYIIAPAEASSNLARYDGVRYGYRVEDAKDVLDMFSRSRSRGFGAEVKRRVMLGTYALSAGYYDAYYLEALKVRTLIRRDFERAFEKYDCLISPTTPSTAFRFGEKVDDPVTMYLSDVFTLAVNLAGLPGVSIPAGFVDGMPVGLQFIGKPFSESTLLRAAYTFEQSTTHHLKRPSLTPEVE
ncbi:MAG: Asp-tRNA(Asn)/Glu-tRNA(Gln) amidotransferase subunit GatA [Eubacteriales bacterium]|nr:Asp-tRNA(Asn)/Glu-tRNA(Gln) amidotransferase subunit GatA [Bacillota bacterium]MBV1727284.1 Asp-tRNA(Asn)/Glu-tRNA(Gln) amidotransferase subunit GatA [Desulforudis sp.]MDP3051325.1 Asp-tRNA(Asn)/Glu-tRNA(Gln) amidotransferase subunit GatA [Eubacteriales bacterium]MDQ7789087.1 Asp-tRNA(Asn)/Glu-tRNA(Gln) amidotransferase subunit GatA [Clostridia bacterium]MBV1735716.1 Asp-tRNA(Asn)/Glu-tRNA(Gln) amidotransferase subunit GatA [Desulforudis sp.]